MMRCSISCRVIQPLLLGIVFIFCGLTARSEVSHHMPMGGYVHDSHNDFLKLALSLKPVTDKVTRHGYHVLYGKYFQRMGMKHNVKKVLEIGLGCNMEYGPGASAKLWRAYVPNASVWFAEYNAACVAAHQSMLDQMQVHVIVGDQSNVTTLHQWVKETGGEFDVIIDDAGHFSHQQYNSFAVLFLHALKPGGVYFVEDIAESDYMKANGHDGFDDVIADWIVTLTLFPEWRVRRDPTKRKLKYKLPPKVKSIECADDICAFIKCYDDDTRCTEVGRDNDLWNYRGGWSGSPVYQ